MNLTTLFILGLNKVKDEIIRDEPRNYRAEDDVGPVEKTGQVIWGLSFDLI